MSLLILQNKVVSKGYLIIYPEDTRGKSLIYNTNSNGHNTEDCRTPLLIRSLIC